MDTLVVIAIVQARFASTRFRGKVLADLCGQPVLEHVLTRAQQIKGVDKVVLALADGDEEQPLHDWAAKYCPCDFVVVVGVPVDDVLARFDAVARSYPHTEIILRLTADCPCIEPAVCERVLQLLKDNRPRADYAWVNTHDGGWCDGLDVEAMTAAALCAAATKATDPAEREHVTPFIRRRYPALCEELPLDPVYAGWPKKLSIDTPEDLDFVRQWMRARKPGHATIANLIVNVAGDIADIRRNIDALDKSIDRASEMADKLSRKLKS